MPNGNRAFPKDSTFSENNWSLLAGFWHPIAYGSEVAARPVAVRLLDQRLVVYRAAGRLVDRRSSASRRDSHGSQGRSTQADAWSIAFRRCWAQLGYTDH